MSTGKRALIHGYLLNGKGGATKISWDAIDQPITSGTKWLHFDYTSRRARRWIKTHSAIDEVIANSLLDPDSRPRSLVHNNGIFLSLRGVNLNPGANPEDMVSIRIWIKDNVIISTRRRHLLAIVDICSAIDNNIGPKTAQEFVAMLSALLAKRIDTVVDKIEEKMDVLEEKVVTQKNLLYLTSNISELRRDAILIKRYLLPQREALYNLQISTNNLVDSEFKLQLSEIRNRLILIIENLEALRDRLSILHEEIASNISMEINSKMFVLAVITIIFLPLTFATGLLGINVGGIPGAASPLGFIFTCMTLLGVTLITILILKFKKWL